MDRAPFHDHGELIAPETGNEVPRLGPRPDARSHLTQQLITRRVTKRVIDPFEAVEIHHQKGPAGRRG